MMNMNWLKENFPQDSNIFVIGCAGLAEEGVSIKRALKHSTVYAFECENFWLERNMEIALNEGIHYFHTAIFSENSTKMFTPSILEKGQPHPWSGSFYKDIYTESKKVYGEPYRVTTIRLDTFCNRFNIKPDFIFMDVEGSEYEILTALGDIRPKAIWTEIAGFVSYETNRTFDEFDDLMNTLGYSLIYPKENGDNRPAWARGSADALYCLNTFEHTDYEETI